MKKIILHKKRRDEVNAASGGNREIPFGHSQEVCLEETRNILKPSDECIQNEMPSSEEPGTRTPSSEQSKTGMSSWIGSPSSDQGRIETQSRSEILKVSSLISGTTLPLPADPVTMVAPRERKLGFGGNRHYLDDTGSEASGLLSYSFPRYYPFAASHLQNVNPATVLQRGRLIDEAYLTGVGLAASSASTPVRYCDERAILPFHSKLERKGYMEQYGFDQTNFSLRRPNGSLLDEAALVSSGDVVGKRSSHSVKIVEDDIDDENMSIRKSRSNVLDDALSYELPKMIDRGSQHMRASPLSVSESYNYSKQDNVRTNSDDTFKSPSVEAHKTVGRPKGRPAKTASTMGDVGPGGRSIIRCPVCGKLFNNSSALAKHKLTHSDERKYVCTLCSKAFKRQDHLNGHLMTHSSTKPFGCKFIGCNKSYCDARSLRRHMENHHLECATGATNSGSSSAGGCFNFDSSFSQHYGADASADNSGSYLRQVSPVNLIIKDGPQLARPFASFSSDNPQNAMWITGYNPLDEPKPIKCDVCGRGFKNIPALNGHMRLHGGYVRKDLDEAQDVSHGSEARSESRFSLNSESSQSSSGFSAKPSLSASEPSRRCFLSRPSSSEGENLCAKPLNVSNNESTSNSFYEELKYFPRVRGDCSNASELQNRDEPGICKSFELDRIKRNSVFEDHHKGKARSLRHSAQNADLEMRSTVEKRNYSHVVTINSVNEILKISADCDTSTMKDPLSETKCEIQRQKSFEDSSCLEFQRQSRHCKKQKRSTDANDISSVVTMPDAVNSWHSNGVGCQIGLRQSDQAKTSTSCGRWAVGSQMSQQRIINSDEEKLQMSGDDCLPDSTNGKEGIDICRLDSKVTCSDGQPKLQSTTYKSGLPQREIIQGVETASALKASDACKVFNLTSDQDFACEVPSSHIEQAGCLYRKRWMNLHLKQAELCCDELPRISTTSVGKQCSDVQRRDGGNTGCGKPTSPKDSSKSAGKVLHQSGIKKSGSVETSDNISSRCLPGSHGTDFVTVRSGPALPVPLADRAASPPSKRGILGLFSHPDVLHRDVTIQASVPSSPYDLHPPTPCAAHTPYTPFTPVNHPGTPKLASHFEFPPQDCLQESSMCDSPSAAHGSQVRRCHRQLDVCLAVEPEGGRYPTQQKPKMTTTETEMKSLHEIHQDEPLYRKVTETRDFDNKRLMRMTSSDGSNRSNVSTQRNLEMHRLYQGSQGQMMLNPFRSSTIQTESWSPDDGMMMAALPTSARRDSHPEASMAGECDSIDYRKQDEQMERKRKPFLSQTKTESECKRPAFGTVAFDAVTLGDVGLQSRQESVKGSNEDDGNLQKKFADHKSGIIFRNPPSLEKVKKAKPLPEPLSIPANVSHFGFPSQMRSSHLWDSFTKPTPTPYTPPPMLSPTRSGPGLFWTLQTGYPSPFAVPSALAKYSKSTSGKSWNEDVHSSIEFEKVPPETDTQPHVNIGPQYQPNLPHYYGCRPLLRDNSKYDDHSSLVWNPVAIEKLGDEEVKQYMDYSCCAALPGNGVNKEYALHLLHLCQGDMKQAGKLLLVPEPRLPQSSGLTNYKYQECVRWNQAEIELFHQTIMKLDKDFFQIAKLVSTKTVKDCVQFYYLWKKIYPDDLKQLKLLRRRRERSELFVRRSEELRDLTPPIRSCDDQSSSGRRSTSSELKKGVNEDSSEPHYQASFSASNSLKEENMEEVEKCWCSICKRSFASARNFDAHLKKHQLSTSGIESVDFSQALKLPYPALSSVF